MMDTFTEMTGSMNYVAPFVICDILLVATIVCICLIDKVKENILNEGKYYQIKIVKKALVKVGKSRIAHEAKFLEVLS